MSVHDDICPECELPAGEGGEFVERNEAFAFGFGGRSCLAWEGCATCREYLEDEADWGSYGEGRVWL